MSRATPWMKFYPADWRGDPAFRLCSLAARGLWLEMLCIMHEATPYGYLAINGHVMTDEQLAVQVTASPDQIAGLLDELEAAGIFARTRQRVIFSRRMVRAQNRKRASK